MQHKISSFPVVLFPLLVVFFILPTVASASIDLPWSSTYNCSEWLSYGDSLNCDGLNKSGSWTASPEGYYEQITAAANNPNGAGGLGQRHWIGDGTNNNSGGTRVTFNNPPGKIWVRWYMRWEAGFGEFGQFKMIYGFANGSNGPLINSFYPSGGMSFEYLTSGNVTCNNCGWGTDFYTSGVSDGSWVYMEMMLDPAGGNLKLWVGPSARLVIDQSGVNFKQPVIDYLLIGENQKNVSNGRSMYVDYDDIAISTTGYIGPVSSGPDTTAPVRSNGSPTSTLSAGTTNTTLSVSTNESATCKFDTNSGTAYASMSTTFSTTGGTTHSHSLTGLTDGTSYTYFVRCQDGSSNQNTNDYSVSFSIANALSRADVNNSSTITTTDALLTLRKSLSLSMNGTGWVTAPTTGDVDCDGTVTTTDALLILRESLGMDMSGTAWCG